MTRKVAWSIPQLVPECPLPLALEEAEVSLNEVMYRTHTIELEPDRAMEEMDNAYMAWCQERYHRPAWIVLGVCTYWSYCYGAVTPELPLNGGLERSDSVSRRQVSCCPLGPGSSQLERTVVRGCSMTRSSTEGNSRSGK